MKKLHILLLLSCIQLGSMYCMESDWTIIRPEQIKDDWEKIYADKIQLLSREGVVLDPEAESTKSTSIMKTRNAITQPQTDRRAACTADQIMFDLLTGDGQLDEASFTYGGKSLSQGGGLYEAYRYNAKQRLTADEAQTLFEKLEKQFNEAYSDQTKRLTPDAVESLSKKIDATRSYLASDHSGIVMVLTEEGKRYIQKYHQGVAPSVSQMANQAPEYANYIVQQQLPDGSIAYALYSHKDIPWKREPYYHKPYVERKVAFKQDDTYQAYQTRAPQDYALLPYINSTRAEQKKKQADAAQNLTKLQELLTLINNANTTTEAQGFVEKATSLVSTDKLTPLLDHFIRLKVEHLVLDKSISGYDEKIINHVLQLMSTRIGQASSTATPALDEKIQALNNLSAFITQQALNPTLTPEQEVIRQKEENIKRLQKEMYEERQKLYRVDQDTTKTPDQKEAEKQTIHTKRTQIEKGIRGEEAARLELLKKLTRPEDPTELVKKMKEITNNQLPESHITRLALKILGIFDYQPQHGFSLISPELLTTELEKLITQASDRNVLRSAIAEEIKKQAAIAQGDPTHTMKALEAKVNVDRNFFFEMLPDAKELFDELQEQFTEAIKEGRAIEPTAK